MTNKDLKSKTYKNLIFKRAFCISVMNFASNIQKNSVSGLILMAVLSISGVDPSHAQHRAQIEAANQRGDHFETLLTFDKVSKRKLSTDSYLAAAKSAWALSLPDRALSDFDLAVESEQLSREQKEQIRFSKAIIHFQEGRADESLMQSQKLYADLAESSPFRARVLALAAQSLIKMGSKAQAEEKLIQAFAESSYLERSDIAYQLAELQNQLGRWEEAKRYLRTIGFEEERAPEALRLLVQISISLKEFSEAQAWLDKSREIFPDQPRDSWTYYVSGLLAAQRGDGRKLGEIVAEAQEKLAPSDGWHTLLQAEHESFLARSMKARPQNIPNQGNS